MNVSTMDRDEILKELVKDMNDATCQIKREEMNDKIESAIGVRPFKGQAPDVPDYPPCTACGKEFMGKLHCARCKCVFYCSKECQKNDWKKRPGGHKAACETMQEECKEMAKEFVDAISDDQNHFLQKIDNNLWSSMDGVGSYKMALDINVNGAIQKLMEDEIEEAQDRFRSGIIASSTQMLMCVLFRNGRNIPGESFSAIDAYRIKKYVHSSDIAFERWFESSLKIISIFQTQGITASRRGDDATFWSIQRTARDIASAWSLVFTSSKASKAILLGTSKEADEFAHTRAKWIIQQSKKIMHQFPEESPDGSAIEGQFNMFTAMIQIRLKEYGVDVGDYVSLLGLKGMKKKMYHLMGIPFAEATIAKGRHLTTAESQKAIMTHAQLDQVLGGSSSSSSTSMSSGSGRKKGKKKNRK